MPQMLPHRASGEKTRTAGPTAVECQQVAVQDPQNASFSCGRRRVAAWSQASLAAGAGRQHVSVCTMFWPCGTLAASDHDTTLPLERQVRPQADLHSRRARGPVAIRRVADRIGFSSQTSGEFLRAHSVNCSFPASRTSQEGAGAPFCHRPLPLRLYRTDPASSLITSRHLTGQVDFASNSRTF